MRALATCIAKAGKSISAIEAKMLRTAAEKYRLEGFAAHESNIGAVSEAIAELEEDMQSIVSQAATYDELRAAQNSANATKLSDAWDKLQNATTNLYPTPSEVYSPSEDPMATASRYLKLSEGWQNRLAELTAAAALPTGGAPLVNGVNVTLSDGRKLMNVKIFDGATLELARELSMSGVIITDMTPGVPPQADDTANLHPKKADVAPTTSLEQRARDAEQLVRDETGRMAAYTDAAITYITRVEASVSSLTAPAQPATPSPMNLADLKQAIAKVKTIEDLPAAIANTALFAEEIARASEESAATRKTAEEAAAAATKKAEEVAAQLATLQQEHATMKAEQAAAAAAVKYQERMATIDEVFTLDDEIKAEIIPEVKACADDASFDKWLSKAKKMMKEKTKDFIKKKKDDECAAAAAGDTDEAKAAKAAQEALASANANPTDAPIHGGATTGGNKSLKDQYAEAFAGGILVGGTSVSELNKKPVKAAR